MTDELKDRVAFITGGARGIGLGIARACALAGARIALVDLDESALAAAERELGMVTEVQTHCLDVTDRREYARVAGRVQGGLGDVSLLVNNAGVLDSSSPSKISHELYDWMRGVNIDGVHNGLHAFLPGMVARRQGHIVNTSSEAGLVPEGAGFLYALTKFAVLGLSESLREEVAPMGIGVTVLLPGPVATEIVSNAQKIRPGSAPARSARADAILSETHQQLLSGGRSPDHVGELVVDAIVKGRPYVFTREDCGPALAQKGATMLDAMSHDSRFLDRLAERGDRR